MCVCARVCVLACVTEVDIRASSLCLSRDSVPSRALKLMVKLRTLLTVFTFILKAKARDYGKGRYISDSCLWCSANHNALVSWPIRADCACRKEGTL